MDNGLQAYLNAKDVIEREQHLDQILTLRAAPVIRQVLRRKLGFYVNGQGVNCDNQNAEDLYQEALLRIVQGLQQLQPSNAIEDFELYVARVAANVCIDFLRTKSPARTRLKYRIRDLLKRHRDLATWEYNGELLCGFANWRNTGKSAFADQPLQEIETKLESFQSIYFEADDAQSRPLAQIVVELFDWIGGPVEVEVMVRIIAHLRNVTDQQIESLDDPALTRSDFYFATGIQANESHIELHNLLARLWRKVIQLPAEQRDTFAFGFEDHAGQDLFTALLAAEIVNWVEIAHGMGRSIQEIVRLRRLMPMDTVTLADELKASRENVYKWRFRAIHRLKTEMGQ